MPEYLGGPGDPPVRRVIPVTKGADRRYTLRRRNTGGDPVDWDADVYVNVGLDPVVKVDADVTGADAVIDLESSLCDQVKSSTTWQAIASFPGTPTNEVPIAVGTFERWDGK